MAKDVGSNCILTIAGTSVFAKLQQSSPDFNRAMQPIIVANGAAPLIGYSPSTGAKSGFKTGFHIPVTGAATLLNAMLSSTPFIVKMQFGATGGASVASCLLTDLTVSGSSGGDIMATAMFESSALPTVGATATAASVVDVFKFIDVTSVTMPTGTTYADVSAFSFNIKRSLSAFHGNSSTGIAKYLQPAITEVKTSSTILKTTDGQGTTAIIPCVTTGDVVILLTQVCAGGNTLTLTASASFYDGYPTVSGSETQFVEESASCTANLGGFTIA